MTATKGAYTSGGFIETDIAGLYQFGIPNGALATGAKAVTLTFSCTGAIDVVKRIVLIGADLRNANSLGLAYLTGDAFARLGAPAGASVSADIADLPTVTEFNARTLAAADYTVVSDLPAAPDNASITAILEDTGTTLDALIKDVPTVAEFEARTLVAASYFDPAADTVARVTLVDTVTTLANMPAAAPSAADIKTELEADGSKLDHLWEMTEDDLGTRRLTANALEQAPAGGGTSDLDELIASHDTEDTLGNVLNDLVEEIGGLYRLTTAALAMAPGGGATTYSYSNTIDDGSGNMLNGVFIQCATDTGFTNIVNTATTNALGAFTVYSDVAGTHYLRLQLAGYTFAIQTVTLA
ncbi:MAG: hypothetical protein IPK44_01145 [Candidatus Accumulibacter sp.]|uniref:hypothetical protein n=1 Tax=Accumulibacter sp. TaxID=2053492 RepID=UPI00258C12BE|nr:hypothetical protein [Accumulibacter sp.]MBK8113204.1 hypothetical protein [Accumulibacter sp.]